MKHGVVLLKKTGNLGDDILTYAAMKLLPRIDYVISREEMSEFKNSENEPVAVLMNGWYLHNSIAFPPSKYIYPKMVGIHFRKSLENEGFFSKEGNLSYFKQLGYPVGARDAATLSLLKRNSIDSYRSLCLTLTIQPFTDVTNQDKIIFVDVFFGNKIRKQIRSVIERVHPNKKIVFLSHDMKMSSHSKLSFEKRMNIVERQLREYSTASCIVTTRLHCALPCLALGIPVLLVKRSNRDYKNRISDYENYFETCTRDELLMGVKNEFFISPKLSSNKDWEAYRDSLIKSCNEFLSDEEKFVNFIQSIKNTKTNAIPFSNRVKNRIYLARHRAKKLFNCSIPAAVKDMLWERI